MKNVLIFGAGIAGKLLISEIEKSANKQYHIFGFIDDFQKKGKRIGKYKILGSQKDVANLVKKYAIDEIIICIPSAQSKVIRHFIKMCEDIKVGFKIVPQLIEIIQKSKVYLEQIRNIQADDLLGREMITTDLKKLETFFKNKIVLVTGAAGSIGSELCRQIAHFKTKLIIFYDWSENGIYDLENEFKKHYSNNLFKSVIGNIQNREKVEFIIKKYKPHFIFHAAAFKHVPLMEYNPEEAIKNNIFGTKIIAEIALKYRVKKFVQISTDKAVNPTNIMGATKRVAELIVRSLNRKNITKFTSVRFGNVLASAGSVIPLFKKQISEGGPVTVTHKSVIRYFMTIKEAVQLVLISSFLGKGGELFVLDMGEPVKILELARSLIRASGLIPGKDIKIKIIGLRPGEKLYEEKLTDKENLTCIKKDKIYITRDKETINNLGPLLNILSQNIKNYNYDAMLNTLKLIVPNFQHQRDNI